MLLVSIPLIPKIWVDPQLNPPDSDGQDHYYFRIEAQQWKYKAYDLIELEKLKTQDSSTNHLTNIVQTDMIGPFEKGSRITIELYSSDILHSFSIDEVGVTKVTFRPDPGVEFSQPTIFSFKFPNKDTILTAYTHIFVGLGTDDMKLQFMVGNRKSI